MSKCEEESYIKRENKALSLPETSVVNIPGIKEVGKNTSSISILVCSSLKLRTVVYPLVYYSRPKIPNHPSNICISSFLIFRFNRSLTCSPRQDLVQLFPNFLT